MDSKTLCLSLLAAESETAVLDIIESTSELKDSSSWFPLDKRDTNFNIVTNQAMTGGKAATELMTNMVDAMLMKYAYLNDIDPKGVNAPPTMHEAVDQLIQNLYGGRLVKASEEWLRDFASKNLVIGITGSSRKKDGLPCYTFADNGEGQDPVDFEDTFLSLSTGNKKDIPFVQGKYNMGSSGVLSFCGRHWFKLVVSRRHDGSGTWGWTIMRRRPGGGVPVAEYFKLGGEIPSFELDMLFPFHKGGGNRYDGFTLETGTVIKLYDFQVGSKFTGFRGAREAFNENLVETILPFRILDFRYRPDPKRTGDRAEGIDPRAFYGMEYLLLRAHTEDQDDEDGGAAAADEGKLTVAVIDDPELGHIDITAILLKRDIPGWLKQPNTNNRVFHAVNGQVQFKQTRGFLTQCGLPALKDRVVIIVDASKLTFEGHNDIWKGDREHIRDTIVGERYRDLVREAIAKSDELKKLQEKVAREELTLIAKSQSNDLFQKLVDADKTLANLLDARDPSIILRDTEPEENKPFEGKYSPTYVELETRFKDGVSIPINKSRPVAAKTDAANDYLHRDENRGALYISDENVGKHFTIRQSLNDGRLTIYFTPVEEKLMPGMSFTFEIGLYDSGMAVPVSDELTIRVVDEQTETKKKKSNGKKKPPKESESPKLGLPKYVLLTKDGRPLPNHPHDKWPEGFSDYDGGSIEDLGDGQVIYKINYDNAYHLKYRQQQRGQVEKDTVTEKYITGMRLLMLGFEHALKRKSNGSGTNDETSVVDEYGDQFRTVAARGAASTVLALADHLPKIVNITDEPE